MRNHLPTILAAGTLTVGVAACGGSSGHTVAAASISPSSQSSGDVVSIAAASSGKLMFDHRSLKARAGRVVIKFTNNAPEDHNFTLFQHGHKVAATPTFHGGTKSITVKLKRGSYLYYCSVPGHEQAGMKGTLTVS